MESEKPIENIEIVLIDRSAKTEPHCELIEKILKRCGKCGYTYELVPIDRIDDGLNYISNKKPRLAIIGLANPLKEEWKGGDYWGNTTEEKIGENEYPGEILIRRCKKEGIPFIIFSGYGEYVREVLERHSAPTGNFIKKPFSIGDNIQNIIEYALDIQPIPQSALV